MEKGNRATEAHHAFNDALIEHIEQATARLARPGKLPEDRVRAIAHEVAIVLLLRSSADPPIRRSLTILNGSSFPKSARNCVV